MIRVTFSPLRVGEVRQLVFPFGTEMAVGETISGSNVAASVWSGVDASPADLMSGSPAASGQTVSQKVTGSGGVLGVVYDVVCTITTSLGQTLQCGGFIAVTPAVL